MKKCSLIGSINAEVVQWWERHEDTYWYRFHIQCKDFPRCEAYRFSRREWCIPDRFEPVGKMHGIHRYTSLADNCPLWGLRLSFIHLLSCNVCFRFGLKELSPNKPQQTRFVWHWAWPNGFQMSPLRCSCPLMRRTEQGVGNFILALRSASRAVR